MYAAAQAMGIKRLIYMSTGSVHGQSPRPGTDETSPLTIFQPFPYNTAKVRAERALMRLRSRGTVELVILRPTIVFGPGSRWVFDFADALQENRAIVVDGGRGICNSIYVDNLAHAVRLAAVTPGIDREIFLVSDDETVTWADLYRPIAAAFGVNYDAVPSVPRPPITKPGIKQLYLEPLRSSELAQAMLTRVPPQLKTMMRKAVRIGRGGRASPVVQVAGPQQVAAPAVSAEMVALHCCRWRLPHAKAKRMLGYVAPVSFSEGCRRSVEWLQERAAAKAGEVRAKAES
jgi:nucleoside-diphosphate-sugar epimerase